MNARLYEYHARKILVLSIAVECQLMNTFLSLENLEHDQIFLENVLWAVKL